jgi:hypothetical protein
MPHYTEDRYNSYANGVLLGRMKAGAAKRKTREVVLEEIRQDFQVKTSRHWLKRLAFLVVALWVLAIVCVSAVFGAEPGAATLIERVAALEDRVAELERQVSPPAVIRLKRTEPEPMTQKWWEAQPGWNESFEDPKPPVQYPPIIDPDDGRELDWNDFMPVSGLVPVEAPQPFFDNQGDMYYADANTGPGWAVLIRKADPVGPVSGSLGGYGYTEDELADYTHGTD